MIRLTVQAEDSEVEQLLSHLDIRDEAGIEDSISLLKRTLKWLCAAQESAYDLMPDPEAIFQIAVDAPSPTVSLPSHKPSESL
jgi:hypothetical protein